MTGAPYRPIDFGVTAVDLRPMAGGTVRVTARTPLGPYPVRNTDRLLHWADRTPGVSYMAKRGADRTWRHLSYAQALDGESRLPRQRGQSGRADDDGFNLDGRRRYRHGATRLRIDRIAEERRRIFRLRSWNSPQSLRGSNCGEPTKPVIPHSSVWCNRRDREAPRNGVC